MEIEFLNSELLERSDADVREIHYVFRFTDSNFEGREGYSNIFVSGSLLSNWAFHFKSKNPLDFDKNLFSLALK